MPRRKLSTEQVEAMYRPAQAPAGSGYFASKEEHDWYAAQYWAMKRKREGYKETQSRPYVANLSAARRP
jgi:hypothetical protein